MKPMRMYIKHLHYTNIVCIDFNAKGKSEPAQPTGRISLVDYRWQGWHGSRPVPWVRVAGGPWPVLRLPNVHVEHRSA